MNKMRIMHGLSEVAGQNYYSVRGLKEIGVNAKTIVWTKHVFGYPCDIDLRIDRTKKYLIPIYAIRLLAFFAHSLLQYDVYHFHYGHSTLNNHELFIYDLLKKKYYYEFHGSDLRDYKKFCEISGMTYTPDLAMSKKQQKRNKRICAKATQIILHDDELIPYLPAEHAPVQVVPLRLDPTLFTPVYPKTDVKKVRIVHAPSKRAFKGTEHVLRAAENLKRRYDYIDLVLVEGKTQEEAKIIYASADIIIDQLYAGTYGVFALEGMALGKPVITYISDDMKTKLPADLPIVSANSNNIEQKLEELILNGEMRKTLGIQSRRYVEDYHDYKKVAQVLLSIYQGSAAPAIGRAAFERVLNVKI